MYNATLQCTVLEVKVMEGLGATIDVILVNGTLHEGDQIVVCTTDGAIVTQARGLLTPPPMKEMRVKTEFVHHPSIEAAMGIKICGVGLDKVGGFDFRAGFGVVASHLGLVVVRFAFAFAFAFALVSLSSRLVLWGLATPGGATEPFPLSSQRRTLPPPFLARSEPTRRFPRRSSPRVGVACVSRRAATHMFTYLHPIHTCISALGRARHEPDGLRAG